jgi:MATE family multidrug resistance protein
VFEEWKRWYRRPAGLGEVLHFTLPLVISTASFMVMQFTDRLFLLDYSPDALAAAMPAGMLAFAVLCFPLGLVGYVSTFVAQYAGAGRNARIGPAVWQAIYLALFFTPLVMATSFLAPQFFAAAGHEPEVARLETIYFLVMNYGAGAFLLTAALSAFFNGRGKTRVVMVVEAAAAALNILLDYAWIFGKWGFPEWGVAGAAWATVASLWCKPLVYAVLFLRPSSRSLYATASGWRWNRPLAARIIQFGASNGLQMFVEIVGFTAFIFFVGELGKARLAATNLAFNINSLAFMPVWGTGIAASMMMGQRLGENKPDLAARATWTAFSLAGGYMLLFSALYLFLPETLMQFHKLDNTGDVKYEQLREVTVVLLRYVAVYCIFDAMYAVFGGAIKGAGDTRYVLITTSVISTSGAAITWAGVRSGAFGLHGCWITITGWVMLLGLMYWRRFLGGRWRTMRVIEPDIVAVEEDPPAELALVPGHSEPATICGN